MAGGALVVIVGSLLPWLRTGGRRRHSYDLFELVERLGFAPGSVAAAALRWWPLVPLLTVGAVVAAGWGWPRVGGFLGVGAAIYAGGTALAVMLAPSGRSIDPLLGTAITAAGSVLLLGGAVAAIVVGFRRPVSWRPPAPP
ncbi:MAG: hypothetical protein ACRDZ2_06355 [Ilumatobacteraceae bacterium]